MVARKFAEIVPNDTDRQEGQFLQIPCNHEIFILMTKLLPSFSLNKRVNREGPFMGI